jgi:hypothetical protein
MWRGDGAAGVDEDEIKERLLEFGRPEEGAREEGG